MKNKNAYAEYKRSGYSKKVQAKYGSELILHKASRTYFDKMGLKKLPTIKSLQAEEQELYQSKDKAYGEYKKVKAEMQEVLTVKSNVERVLGLDPTKKTKEKSSPER